MALAAPSSAKDRDQGSSPFPGVVADLATEVGEYATPSPPAVPVPPAIDLLEPASIFISAPMDEVDSARIKPGLEARLTVDSHRGRSFPAVLRIAFRDRPRAAEPHRSRSSSLAPFCRHCCPAPRPTSKAVLGAATAWSVSTPA